MKIKNIIVLVGIAFLASCSKTTLQPNKIEFDVISMNSSKQATTTFNLGDTVCFNFTGNPDQITFFSGEKGYRYGYTNRSTDSTSAIDTLRFSAALNTAGNGALQLLVSTTFPNYTQINSTDSANVIATYPSGWTDITSRANLPATASSIALKSNVSLNDFATPGKPIWLAFRYKANAAVAQSKWTITALGLRHYSDTSYCIDSINSIYPVTYPTFVTSPGWGVVSVANPLIKFAFSSSYYGNSASGVTYSASTSTSNNTFTVTGNTSASSAVATETWVISGPVNLYTVFPDGGVAVKDMTTNASNTVYTGTLSTWANYAYIFKQRGTYNVTFLAATNTTDKSNSVAKTMTISVQ